MQDKQESKKENYSAGPAKKVHIHTMPEKFYLEDKKSGKGKNTFLIVAVIIMAVLVIGGGGYFIFNRMGQSDGDQNDNSALVLNNAAANDNAAVVNNGNANSNISINANANTNLDNTNTSVNDNSNTGNVNLVNIFSNTNASSNANTALNVNSVPDAQDTDSDGLTDEEESLYGTSISVPDTDSDSYADGQELVSGYNPNGSGSLELSTRVRRHTEDSEGYSLLYPAVWEVSDDPLYPRGKVFTTTGEFIIVNIEENPSRLSARDWYIANSPGIDTSKVLTVQNWDKTLSGALSLDGLVVYYTKGNRVYVVSYNTNLLSQANYRSTFEMMYKSFTAVSVSVNSNSNTNLNTNTSSNSNSSLNYNFNFNNNTSTNTNASLNINTNANTNTNSNVNNSNRL